MYKLLLISICTFWSIKHNIDLSTWWDMAIQVYIFFLQWVQILHQLYSPPNFKALLYLIYCTMSKEPPPNHPHNNSSKQGEEREYLDPSNPNDYAFLLVGCVMFSFVILVIFVVAALSLLMLMLPWSHSQATKYHRHLCTHFGLQHVILQDFMPTCDNGKQLVKKRGVVCSWWHHQVYPALVQVVAVQVWVQQHHCLMILVDDKRKEVLGALITCRYIQEDGQIWKRWAT